MIVLGVNKILEWCQVFSNGRRYTCITKEIDGQLFFHFKKAWHPVVSYISDQCMELARDSQGRCCMRPFRK